jgi:hypothetical protein
MQRPQTSGSLHLVDELNVATPEPSLTLLMARHEQAVKAARLQAVAPYGSVASRKRHLAWKAAEAAFAASIARLAGELAR